MNMLVDGPSGAQEIIVVGEGGGYFDVSRVLWDEREDGPLPAVTLGGMVRHDGALVFSQKRMDEHIAALKPRIAESVTMRQCRIALLDAGLLDAVQSSIASMPGTDGERARIDWEYAQEVRRDWPLIGYMAGDLGLTDEQVDGLFMAASAI